MEGFFRINIYNPTKREVICHLKDGKTIEGTTITIRQGNLV